jgi:hypothetical protein
VSTGLTNNWEGEDEDLDNVKVRFHCLVESYDSDEFVKYSIGQLGRSQ